MMVLKVHAHEKYLQWVWWLSFLQKQNCHPHIRNHMVEIIFSYWSWERTKAMSSEWLQRATEEPGETWNTELLPGPEIIEDFIAWSALTCVTLSESKGLLCSRCYSGCTGRDLQFSIFCGLWRHWGYMKSQLYLSTQCTGNSCGGVSWQPLAAESFLHGGQGNW